MKFDRDTLRALRDVQEVRIRTEKHPNPAIVIWVVVAGDDVFVRSWLGTKGAGTETLRRVGAATLEFGAHWLAVQAIPASDPDTVTQVSRAFLRKHQPSAHAQEMVRSEILPTTLRLEPR
jgi:Uncharacterized protein conserved in bacteria (DUF2255)